MIFSSVSASYRIRYGLMTFASQIHFREACFSEVSSVRASFNAQNRMATSAKIREKSENFINFANSQWIFWSMPKWAQKFFLPFSLFLLFSGEFDLWKNLEKSGNFISEKKWLPCYKTVGLGKMLTLELSWEGDLEKNFNISWFSSYHFVSIALH